MATHEFVMEGRVCTIETRRIKVHVLPLLNNEFGKYLYNQDFTEGGSEIKRGKLEQIVLLNGTRKLRVGGEDVKLDPARPARSLPDLWDESEDEWVSIYEKILQFIVFDNPWLYKKQPYGAVFGLYAPEEEMDHDEEEEQEVEDPTALGLGSSEEVDLDPEDSFTNGSTSTTGGKESQETSDSGNLSEITNPVQ